MGTGVGAGVGGLVGAGVVEKMQCRISGHQPVIQVESRVIGMAGQLEHHICLAHLVFTGHPFALLDDNHVNSCTQDVLEEIPSGLVVREDDDGIMMIRIEVFVQRVPSSQSAWG